MNVAFSVLFFVYLCYADLDALTNEERSSMLREHNARRSGVIPTATNMLLMQWDFDLENIAYEHASRCVFEHGGLEGLNSTGQNIGASSNVDQTPVDLLKIWFDDETASFDLNNPSHYTQIAWASSNRVGCSKAMCTPLSGNVLGMPVYRAGTSCSACPSTHPVCIQGLCSPGEADSGDENFGAMVFPEGDDVKENTTEPAAPEEFPPEEQLKRLDKADLDEDINATALKHQRKQHQKLKPQHKPHQKYRVTKRGVPDGGVLVPGDCQDGRFHTWVEVDRGSFSDNVTFSAVIVITVATQIYYSHAIETIGGTEATFNEEPHLFSCLEDDRPMTVYVFNCAGHSEPCGEAYGVPMDLLPAYQFTLETWDEFEEGEEVELSGGPGDPRKLVLKFNYGETSGTNTGAIVAGCLVVLIIIAAVVGFFYWKKKQAEAPAYGHVDRV